MELKSQCESKDTMHPLVDHDLIKPCSGATSDKIEPIAPSSGSGASAAKIEPITPSSSYSAQTLKTLIKFIFNPVFIQTCWIISAIVLAF